MYELKYMYHSKLDFTSNEISFLDKKAFFVVSKTQIYELSASSTEEQKK